MDVAYIILPNQKTKDLLIVHSLVNDQHKKANFNYSELILKKLITKAKVYVVFLIMLINL